MSILLIHYFISVHSAVRIKRDLVLQSCIRWHFSHHVNLLNFLLKQINLFLLFHFQCKFFLHLLLLLLFLQSNCSCFHLLLLLFFKQHLLFLLSNPLRLLLLLLHLHLQLELVLLSSCLLLLLMI